MFVALQDVELPHFYGCVPLHRRGLSPVLDSGVPIPQSYLHGNGELRSIHLALHTRTCIYVRSYNRYLVSQHIAEISYQENTYISWLWKGWGRGRVIKFLHNYLMSFVWLLLFFLNNLFNFPSTVSVGFLFSLLLTYRIGLGWVIVRFVYPLHWIVFPSTPTLYRTGQQ